MGYKGRLTPENGFSSTSFTKKSLVDGFGSNEYYVCDILNHLRFVSVLVLTASSADIIG